MSGMHTCGLKPSVLSISIAMACLCSPIGSSYAADATTADPAAQTAPSTTQSDAAPAEQHDRAVTLTTITVNADKSDGYKTNYVQVGAFRDQTILDTPSTINVLPRAIIDAQNSTGI